MNNGKFLPEYNWVWSPQGFINMQSGTIGGTFILLSMKMSGKDSFFNSGMDDYINGICNKPLPWSFYREKGC